MPHLLYPFICRWTLEDVYFGSNDIYIFFPFSLFVCVYVYASVCDFVCIALLLPFVLEFCLPVFKIFSPFFSIVFSACYHWWICFLVWLLSSFFLLFLLLKIFFNNYFFKLFYFILPFSFILSFFLPLILSSEDDRLLVLHPGMRAVPLRWENQVLDIGPPEASQLHER